MVACIDTLHIWYPYNILKHQHRIDVTDVVDIASYNGRIVRIVSGDICKKSVWEATGTRIKFEVHAGKIAKMVCQMSGYITVNDFLNELRLYSEHYDQRSGSTISTGLLSKGSACRIDLFIDLFTETAKIMSGLDISDQSFILGMADYEEHGRRAGRYDSYRIGRKPATFRIYNKYKQAVSKGLGHMYNNPTTRIELSLEGAKDIRAKLGLSRDLKLHSLGTQLQPLLDSVDIFAGMTLRHVQPHPLDRFKTEKQRMRAIQFHRDWETGTFFDVRRLMNTNSNGSDQFYRKYFQIRRYAQSKQPSSVFRRNLSRFIGQNGHQVADTFDL